MNLKDLPGYIKSLQERGITEDSENVVVNIGSITTKKDYTKFAFAISICLCLIALASVYNVASKNIKITSASGLSSSEIASIVKDTGVQVVSIDQESEGTYRVKVLTFKNVKSFFDQLRTNKGVESVELR